MLDVSVDRHQINVTVAGPRGRISVTEQLCQQVDLLLLTPRECKSSTWLTKRAVLNLISTTQIRNFENKINKYFVTETHNINVMGLHIKVLPVPLLMREDAIIDPLKELP